jgi:hypothetical protein
MKSSAVDGEINGREAREQEIFLLSQSRIKLIIVSSRRLGIASGRRR